MNERNSTIPKFNPQLIKDPKTADTKQFSLVACEYQLKS